MRLVVAKAALGAKSNSCTFNSNLIRALNGFSAQPLSALTVSLSPNSLNQFFSPRPPLHLYAYPPPLHLSPLSFLTPLTLFTSATLSLKPVLFSHPLPIQIFSISSPCRFISLTLSFALSPFLSPPHLTSFLPPPQPKSMWVIFLCTQYSEWRRFSLLFFPNPPH